VSNILESVLSTILVDMINAQNQANIRSAQLAEEYVGQNKTVELLQFFDVPSANIKSFDFELKFGLESTGSPIGKKMSNKLSELISHSLQEFVQACMEKYKLPIGSDEELKKFIGYQWKGGSKKSAGLSFEHDPKIINDSNKFIITLKKNIKSLTDSELFLDEKERAPGLKAILNVSDLNSYNGDMLCSINVKAEIAGMKAGFADKTEGEGSEKETKRKIFLVGS